VYVLRLIYGVFGLLLQLASIECAVWVTVYECSREVVRCKEDVAVWTNGLRSDSARVGLENHDSTSPLLGNIKSTDNYSISS
jgi:hypothetical protein